jgi:hypothetical protein
LEFGVYPPAEAVRRAGLGFVFVFVFWNLLLIAQQSVSNGQQIPLKYSVVKP